MKQLPCGCCQGIEPLTPLSILNRPGLHEIRYRVGTHRAFLETMVARLSSHHLADGRRPLHRLSTRAPDDPALALLDAWATVADVLTFYQERIANEGYLLTATERRSVLELARLVGYRLRPGVAASVYLAFTLDKGMDIHVPAGTRARSVPGPDELPQAFETDEPLHARTGWNVLLPRRSRPQLPRPAPVGPGTRDLWVAGTASGLEPGDTLLFACGQGTRTYAVRAVEIDREAGRTRVAYADYRASAPAPSTGSAASSTAEVQLTEPPGGRLTTIVQALGEPPSHPPPSRYQLARTTGQAYRETSDLGPQLLTRFVPRLRDTLYAAYANAPVPPPDPETSPVAPCRVEVLRVRGAPFGHNAPKRPVVPSQGGVTRWEEWDLFETDGDDVVITSAADRFRTLSLDTVHEGIQPGDTVVLDRGGGADLIVTDAIEVRTISRADYAISGRVTELVLGIDWLTDADQSLGDIRETTVFTRNEALGLAEEPIEDEVTGDLIELDGLFEGLDAGRWLLVQGERADVLDAAGAVVEGIEASELVMLAGVEHDVQQARHVDGAEILDRSSQPIPLPGDTLHTRLVLSEPLAYRYRRDTVRINANVVGATHGETHEETLGSGDASRAFQAFTLSHDPLTFAAAPTPAGVESTLEVRVDGVRWPEQPTLLYLDGDDRGYLTTTDDEGRTSVVFGDGRHGARPSSGIENVIARYRSGIGRAGNVGSGRISQLATRPLGVKDAFNPQQASGGADPESRDQARRNVPLAVLALDRLVSVQDYADFARTFAGIGKASAISLSDGRREVLHLSIAGADDIAIETSSALYRNLLLALDRFGDPHLPLQVDVREAVFVLLSARVRVLTDHLWSLVEPRVRVALLETLGFDRRDLGQDVLLSEVIHVIQSIEGVDYVDVELLDGIAESDARDPDTDALDPERLADKLQALAESLATPAEGEGCGPTQPRQRVVVRLARVASTAVDAELRIRPAQIAYLNPELPDTLILTEMTS
jgi:predicted phage baseplate assembly protein